jgi:hypothetical protein
LQSPIAATAQGHVIFQGDTTETQYTLYIYDFSTLPDENPPLVATIVVPENGSYSIMSWVATYSGDGLTFLLATCPYVSGTSSYKKNTLYVYDVASGYQLRFQTETDKYFGGASGWAIDWNGSYLFRATIWSETGNGTTSSMRLYKLDSGAVTFIGATNLNLATAAVFSRSENRLYFPTSTSGIYTSTFTPNSIEASPTKIYSPPSSNAATYAFSRDGQAFTLYIYNSSGSNNYAIGRLSGASCTTSTTTALLQYSRVSPFGTFVIAGQQILKQIGGANYAAYVDGEGVSGLKGAWDSNATGVSWLTDDMFAFAARSGVSGGIVKYDADTDIFLPVGTKFCVPDLRGKMILGAKESRLLGVGTASVPGSGSANQSGQIRLLPCIKT